MNNVLKKASFKKRLSEIAGAWEMSDKEVEEFKEGIKKLEKIRGLRTSQTTPGYLNRIITKNSTKYRKI